MHPARDHHLPPDPDAYRHAPHPKGRIIVIAPTRAACETIELALGLQLDTLLEREHGAEIRALASSDKGFGIVAGTGTGKTLGIRPIAESILGESLRVGVVNREREATPETPSWNVVIVTTGIARRWFQDDLITGRDTVIVDEIHQTSAELELCLALGKRAGCRFIWLSATVDPAFYARYLDSAEVLQTYAFDPKLKAKVQVLPQAPDEFLNERYVRHIMKERRGVAVFLPTRAEVERLGQELGEQWKRLSTAFYHGGEPIRVIRPFLEGEVERPFLLAMTAAGQSALNVPGLDTVVIYDARYGNVVERGRNVLHRLYLGANEILQMAGRVHGRVPNGEVVILSDRELDFATLRPSPPEFQLAGDAERVAITCAALGVDARDLDLPVPLDRTAYRRSLELLTSRGLIEHGKLTTYGREVEALPVERPWGELLVHASGELVPIAAVCANIDSLHRMTREERDLHGLVVNGSDHLTAYNVYAEALNQHGYLGEVYGLPRHLFEEGLDGVGRAAGRADEGDRRHRARSGLGLSLARAAAAAAARLRVQGPAHGLDGPGRAGDAVRSGHRRAHRRRSGGAGLQDVGGRQLGRGGRRPPLLRGPLRDCPGVHRGHHALLRPDRVVRDHGRPPRQCSPVHASISSCRSSAGEATSASSWIPRSSRSAARYRTRPWTMPGGCSPMRSFRPRWCIPMRAGCIGRPLSWMSCGVARAARCGRLRRTRCGRASWLSSRACGAGRTSRAPASRSIRVTSWTRRPGSGWTRCPGWSGFAATPRRSNTSCTTGWGWPGSGCGRVRPGACGPMRFPRWTARSGSPSSEAATRRSWRTPSRSSRCCSSGLPSTRNRSRRAGGGGAGASATGAVAARRGAGGGVADAPLCTLSVKRRLN